MVRWVMGRARGGGLDRHWTSLDHPHTPAHASLLLPSTHIPPSPPQNPNQADGVRLKPTTLELLELGRSRAQARSAAMSNGSNGGAGEP